MSYENAKEKFLNEVRQGSQLWTNEQVVALVDALKAELDEVEERVTVLEP